MAECYLYQQDARVGRTCLTLLLNHKGTIEGEATVARTGPESFYFVTGAPSERRVLDWMTLHCGVPMEGVTLTNVTDATGILCLAGPQSRDVLQACTVADVSNDKLRWLSSAPITVAGVPLLALRLSFTGELAYELHAPNEQLGVLWDALWDAGQKHGIAPFALNRWTVSGLRNSIAAGTSWLMTQATRMWLRNGLQIKAKTSLARRPCWHDSRAAVSYCLN